MAQQEKIFIDGMRFEAPSEKTPEWIKGKISIKIDSLLKFLEEHRTKSGWLNVDLKESKNGVLYLELNTYKKGDEKKGGFDVRRAKKEESTQDDTESTQLEEDLVPEIPF